MGFNYYLNIVNINICNYCQVLNDSATIGFMSNTYLTCTAFFRCRNSLSDKWLVVVVHKEPCVLALGFEYLVLYRKKLANFFWIK